MWYAGLPPISQWYYDQFIPSYVISVCKEHIPGFNCKNFDMLYLIYLLNESH